MYLLQTIYPFSLASANIAMGWFLYHLSEPVLGVLLVLIGLFVVLASIGSTVSQRRPVLGKST